MNVIRDSLNRNKNSRGRNRLLGKNRFSSLPVYQRIRSGATTSNNLDVFTRPSTVDNSSNSFGSRSNPSDNALSNNARTSDSNNTIRFDGQTSDFNTQNRSSDECISGNLDSNIQIMRMLGSERLESERNESISLPSRYDKGARTESITLQTNNCMSSHTHVDFLQQNQVSPSTFPPAAVDNRFINSDSRQGTIIDRNNNEKSNSFKLCFDKLNFPSTVSDGASSYGLAGSKQKKSIFGLDNQSSSGTNISNENSFQNPQFFQSPTHSRAVPESPRFLSKGEFADTSENRNHMGNTGSLHHESTFKRMMDTTMADKSSINSILNHTRTAQHGTQIGFRDNADNNTSGSGFFRTPTVSQHMPVSTSLSQRGNQLTPKPAVKSIQGLFPLSLFTDNINRSGKVNMRSSSDEVQSHVTPTIRQHAAKSATPVGFRGGTKILESNNHSGSEITSGFLRTPTVEQHIPVFTCSPERGVQYTPKPADKSIQGLFPLSSFTDSVKRSSNASIKSTSDGLQSHVNSSERHRISKSTSSDRHRTPNSATSEESNHNTILAVTEGRGLARGEVGIAVMDTRRPQLILCQISDVQTYINTLTKVQIFNPVEILVPSTFVENVQPESLFSKLNDNFPHVNLTSVQRRHFSETEGLNLVQGLCLEDYSTIELIVQHKFYALAALAALIKFIEFSQSMLFSKKSLKILYQSAEEVMSIDLDTAKRLELVLSTTGDGMQKSLLTIFNYCNTLSGRRFLRANILQPPSKLNVINERLTCVNELVQDSMMITNLKIELKKFNDVEQLLWLCMQIPSMSAVTKSSEMQMNYILLLHTTMKSLPALQECLRETKSKLFCSFKQVLVDDRFKLILDKLTEYINEDARPAKGFMPSQQQRCFAIKPEVNGLLDVARCTYSKLVDRTSDIVKNLSEEYDLPLKWGSSYTKGIHIILNTSQNKNFKLTDMPSIFIQVNRSRQNTITCTTEELLILNQRMKHCLQEIQLMSNVIISELVHEIRQHIGCLYKLCEVIAELDMLVCFALVSSSSDYVSPIFGSKLELKSSRHPILDVVSSSRPIGNDVSASQEKNFHIITGPNMGGKSVYIRQIALLQILAQMGCFVPAEYAEFKIMDCILSRIGFDDSIEHNASTFSMEMRQINYILQALETDRKCLIIIDELCRGTSCEEGVAIAWAVCEKLAESKAFTYITTHFQLLTTLQNSYPNVSNWHFEAEELSDERLKYTHRLLLGVSTVSNYGIKLAKMASLPDSIMKDIIILKNKLSLEYQVMMSDTVLNESNPVHSLTIRILDGIESGKSNMEIINSLKQIRLNSTSTLQRSNSNIQVREPAVINDSVNESTQNRSNSYRSIDEIMDDNNPHHTSHSKEIQSNNVKMQLEGINEQSVEEYELQSHNVAKQFAEMKEKSVNEHEIIQSNNVRQLEEIYTQNVEVREAQFHNDGMRIVEMEGNNVEEQEIIQSNDTEMQLEVMEEDETQSNIVGAQLEETKKQIVEEHEIQYNNVEVQLEEMEEENEENQEINNNNIVAIQEKQNNLTSQELFDILHSQRTGTSSVDGL